MWQIFILTEQLIFLSNNYSFYRANLIEPIFVLSSIKISPFYIDLRYDVIQNLNLCENFFCTEGNIIIKKIRFIFIDLVLCNLLKKIHYVILKLNFHTAPGINLKGQKSLCKFKKPAGIFFDLCHDQPGFALFLYF
jgi:hypothetical protein